MENNSTLKKMTCIVCPIGCRLEIEVSKDNKVTSVSGNTCKRGEAYAVSETENPVRTLTTTVKLQNSENSMLPVKTSAPIPKSTLLAAMTEIQKIIVSPPIKSGTVIKNNFITKNTNLIATKSVEK